MNTDLDPEVLELARTLRRMFATHAAPASLRALWDTESGRDPHLWRRLADMGVTALVVPVEFGGLGLGAGEGGAVMHEIGRAAVPDAVLESCLLAPAIIAASSDDELKARWLPGLASGELRATIAGPDSGIAPDAHVSDAVLSISGASVTLHERSELEITAVRSIDPSRRMFDTSARSHAGRVVTPTLDPSVHGLRRVATAAQLNGLAERMIEMSTAYALVREQFGRVIGSFQAVKHQLATASSLNTLAGFATRAAAWRLDQNGADAIDAATLAHVCAMEAAKESNRTTLQVHGGIGFTWEHDLQIWLKHAKAIELAYGSHYAVAAESGLAATGASDPTGLAV